MPYGKCLCDQVANAKARGMWKTNSDEVGECKCIEEGMTIFHRSATSPRCPQALVGQRYFTTEIPVWEGAGQALSECVCQDGIPAYATQNTRVVFDGFQPAAVVSTHIESV